MVSLAKSLILECNKILEDKYMIIDKQGNRTISGDTGTGNVVVKATDGSELDRQGVQDSIKRAKEELPTQDANEIKQDLEDVSKDFD